MSCRRNCIQYYEQLENGIAEMEVTVERLRMEIHELIEIKDALNKLNSTLEIKLKEQVGDLPF